jgi:hypothetical protein
MAPNQFGGPVRTLVKMVNAGALTLADVPGLGPLVGRYITGVSYVGRRSGRSFTLPVGYRRTGATVTIRVALPDQKTWWRNFLGDGAPMTIRLDGSDRTGHAVARRDERGRVTVTLTLDGR